MDITEITEGIAEELRKVSISTPVSLSASDFLVLTEVPGDELPINPLTWLIEYAGFDPVENTGSITETMSFSAECWLAPYGDMPYDLQQSTLRAIINAAKEQFRDFPGIVLGGLAMNVRVSDDGPFETVSDEVDTFLVGTLNFEVIGI